MVPDALVEKYRWVNAIEGWTVAVMRRRPVDEVVGIYGGGQAEPVGDLAFADIDRHRGPDAARLELFVQVMAHDGHTVTLEPDGWSGAFPEIARRCSAGGGRLFSVYWNIHAAGMVTEAVDGHVVARFESIFPIAPEPREGDLRPAWAIGPTPEADVSWQICMAHLEGRTGVEVGQGWLTRPLRTYRIPEPHRLYRTVEGADAV